MEVNTNMRGGGVDGITPPQRSTTAASNPAGAAPDSFASSNALDSALKNLPASRPDAVARAKALAADPNYPSADTLRQVSSLLAQRLTSPSE
jgi:hypothetical protein